MHHVGDEVVAVDSERLKPKYSARGYEFTVVNILKNGKVSVSCSQELLQNAEDAGASRIILTLDERVHDDYTLIGDQLKVCQGPALLAFNDAHFKPDDWANIQKTERSYKALEKERIGRFGIGWNVVYHLTDFPWIVSGKDVGVMDPRETGVFEDEETGRSLSGHRMTLHQLAEEYPHQFQPFSSYIQKNRRQEEYLNGTLFRFPLRKTLDGISDSTWVEENSMDLLNSILVDAPRLLQFLHNISNIQINHWPDGEPEPLRLFDLKAQRREIDRDGFGLSQIEIEWSMESRMAGVLMEEMGWISLYNYQPVDPPIHIQTLSNTIQASTKVSVALPTYALRDGSHKGHTFCYLPLPMDDENVTGLPVDIHASFSLTDSRRSIFPCQKQGDIRGEWNYMIVNELMPQVYSALIKDQNSHHQLWPNTGQISSKWYPLASSIYADPDMMIYCHNLMDMFPIPRCLFLPNNHHRKLSDQEWARVADCISRVCELTNTPLCTEPEYLAESLEIACPDKEVDVISPAVLTDLIAENMTFIDPQLLQQLQPDLIQYFLTSVSVLEGDHGSLTHIFNQLPFLFPILNSTYSIDKDIIFMSEDKDLLETFDGVGGIQFLDPAYYQVFKEICLTGKSKLVQVDERGFRMLVESALASGSLSISSLWSYLCMTNWNLSILEGLKILPVICGGQGELENDSVEATLMTLGGENDIEQTPPLLIPRKRVRFIRKYLGSSIPLIPTDSYVTKHYQLNGYVLDHRQPLELMKAILSLSATNNNSNSSLNGCVEENNQVGADFEEMEARTRQKEATVRSSSSKVFRLKTSEDKEDMTWLRDELSQVSSALSTRRTEREEEEDRLKDENENDDAMKQELIGRLSSTLPLFYLPPNNGNAANNPPTAGNQQKQSNISSSPAHKNNQSFPPSISVRPTTTLPSSLHSFSSVNNKNKDAIVKEKEKEAEAEEEKDSEEWTFVTGEDANYEFLDPNQLSLFNSLRRELTDSSPSTEIVAVVPLSSTCEKLGKLLNFRRISVEDIIRSRIERIDLGLAHWIFSNWNSLPHPESLVPIINPQLIYPLLERFTNETVSLKDEDSAVVICYFAIIRYLECREEGIDWDALNGLNWIACTSGVLHHRTSVTIGEGEGPLFVKNVCPYLCPVHSRIRGSSISDHLEPVQIPLTDFYKTELILLIKEASTPEEPLDRSLLAFVLEILEDLQEWKSGTSPLPLLPDSQGILRPVDSLVQQSYGDGHDKDDEDWELVESDETDRLSAVATLHPLISKNVAERFSVPTMVDLQLREFCAGDGMDQFGQEVNLTDRIGRLVEEYHGDLDFIHEFIQNAEDANASSISFVLDTRYNPTRNILSENWAYLQGPAILVVNDSVFSADDIDGIQQVGVGSKRDRPDKIGRFGAGFNCAYKYTDCPAFISDDAVLCIFDPLRQYIASQSSALPGTMLNIGQSKQRFATAFKDTYNTFKAAKEKSADLSGRTVFRLPLRFRPSGISKQIPRIDDIRNSWMVAAHTLHHSLLFLDHIRQVSACVIDENGARRNLWTITSTTTNLPNQLSTKDFSMSKAEFTNSSSSDPQRKVQKCSYLTNLAVVSENGKNRIEEKWLISQRLGFTNPPKDEFHELKLLPAAGVGRPLIRKHQNGSVDTVSCSLPLPSRTNLPFALHGHFAVDEARKVVMTTSSSDNSIGNKWNDEVTNDLLLGAFFDLLEVVRTTGRSLDSTRELTIDDYWQCFPRMDQVHTDWQPWAERLYQNFVQTGLVPVLGHSNWGRLTIGGFEGVGENGNGDSDESDHVYLWTNEEDEEDVEKNVDMGYIHNDKGKKTIHLLSKLGLALAHLNHSKFHWIQPALLQHGARVITPQIMSKLLRSGQISITNNFESRYASKNNPREKISPCSLPIALSQSVFGQIDQPAEGNSSATGLKSLVGIESLKQLLAYLLGQPQKMSGYRSSSTPGAQETEGWGVNLRGLPLCLCMDGMLRRFETSDPGSDVGGPFYLQPQHVAQLFPRSAARFIHYDLLPLLNGILSDENSSGGQQMIQQITMECLPDLLESRLRHCIAGFNRWKLLPIKLKGKLSFAPLSLMKYTLEDDQELMTQLGLPFFHCPNQPFNRRSLRLVDGWKELRMMMACGPENLLAAISYWNELSDEEDSGCGLRWHDPNFPIRSVVKFIADLTDEIPPTSIHKLRKFPIFKSVHGDYEVLDRWRSVYIVNDSDQIPGHGGWWRRRADETSEEDESGRGSVLFLSHIPILDQLYRRLAIPNISIVQVYAEYVVPLMNRMDLDSRVEHLCVLAEREELRKDEGVIKSLSTIPLVPSPYGILYVSQFRDCRLPFFNFLTPESERLSRELISRLMDRKADEKFWFDFLVQLGLRTVPNEEDIVAYGLMLQRERTQLPMDALNARILVLMDNVKEHCLLAGMPLDKYRSALEKLSRIPIIPAKKLCEKYIQFLPGKKEKSNNNNNKKDQTAFISIEGSICSQWESIVWAASDCLPEWLSDDHLMINLGAKDAPGLDLIMAHAARLYPRLQAAKLGKQSTDGINSSKSIATLREMTGELLIELDKHLSEEGIVNQKTQENRLGIDKTDNKSSSEACTALSVIPLVIVEDGKRLVAPNMTVLRMPDYMATGVGGCIPPFLYQLPSHLYNFQRLFTALGMTHEPTMNHYVRVLANIRHALPAGVSSINNPNIMEAIERSQRGLVMACHSVTTPASFQDLFTEPSLCLLGNDGRLHDSHKLLYKDITNNDFEVGYGNLLNEEPMIWSQPSVAVGAIRHFISILPSVSIRPKLLSEEFEERINESESVQCHCDQGNSLTALIQSQHFFDGLLNIYRREFGAGSEPTGWGDEDESSGENDWIGRMGVTEIICYERIKVDWVERRTGRVIRNHDRKKGGQYYQEEEEEEGSNAISFHVENLSHSSHQSPWHGASSPHHSRQTRVTVATFIRIKHKRHEEMMEDLALALQQLVPFQSFQSAILLQRLLNFQNIPMSSSAAPSDFLSGKGWQNSLVVGHEIDEKTFQALLMSANYFYTIGELVGYLDPDSEDDKIILARVIGVSDAGTGPKSVGGKTTGTGGNYKLALNTKGTKFKMATALDMYKFYWSEVIKDEEGQEREKRQAGNGRKNNATENGAQDTSSDWVSCEEDDDNDEKGDGEDENGGDGDIYYSFVVESPDNQQNENVVEETIPLQETHSPSFDTDDNLHQTTTTTEDNQIPSDPFQKHHLSSASSSSKTTTNRPSSSWMKSDDHDEEEEDLHVTIDPNHQQNDHGTPTSNRNRKPLPFKEEITRELEEAWVEDEEKRKKMVRRLMLKWHPDKNKSVIILTEADMEVVKSVSNRFRPVEGDGAPEAHEGFLHLKNEMERLGRKTSDGGWWERTWKSWEDYKPFTPKWNTPKNRHTDSGNWLRTGKNYWEQAQWDKIAAEHFTPGPDHVVSIILKAVERCLKSIHVLIKGYPPMTTISLITLSGVIERSLEGADMLEEWVTLVCRIAEDVDEINQHTNPSNKMTDELMNEALQLQSLIFQTLHPVYEAKANR